MPKDTLIRGPVYVLEDNIDTDLLIPACYLNLVPTIPEEYRTSVEKESEIQKPLLAAWNKIIRKVADEHGFQKVKSAADLIDLSKEDLARFIASVPDEKMMGLWGEMIRTAEGNPGLSSA